MCDFCDNIKDVEQYKEHPFYERDNTIVQTKEKTFGLWIECDDYFYSRIAMYINYCPMCGTNLKLKEDKSNKEKKKSPFAQWA